MSGDALQPGSSDVAGFDVTQAVERELAGHPVFGDTRGILDRARTLALMRLEALSRGPSARELFRELRKEGNRRAAADVLDDPVVLRIGRELLEAVRRGERSPSGEAEAVFAAVLHHLRRGPPGLPVAAGCAHHFRSRPSGPSITVWDPDVPETVVNRRFALFAGNLLSGLFPERRSRCLLRPEPGFVDALRRGCDLLALLLPELSASVLDHVRLVGVLRDGRSSSASITFLAIPSTMFLSGKIVKPWRAAETLLHEAVHLKMTDLATARSLYRPGALSLRDGAPTIRAIWRKEQGPLADWPIRRAWYAFHVYVHLALFFARVERMEEFLADDFGTPPVPGGLGLERALGRAGYLGEELAAHVERVFDLDGRRLFAWLRRMLSCLCDADTLRAHVERLRGDRWRGRP